MTALMLLVACNKGRPPPVVVVPTDTDADTAAPPEPVTTGGPDARTFLEPSAQIHATGDFTIAVAVALMPAHGSDPGQILFSVRSPSRFPGEGPVLVVEGNAPRGDHDLMEVWDGVSLIEQNFPWWSVVNAGDVNNDGHLDLWYGDKLIRGPLLGRTVFEETEDYLVTLDREVGVAGNFDADGDGEIDVITQHGTGQQGFVRYGPLSGALPSASRGEADPATYSSLGESAGCGVKHAGYWLEDHLGPGHDAIAIGMDYSACTYDVFIWDPFVPRGTHTIYDHALAAIHHFPQEAGDVAVNDPGDVDGDGHPEVIYEYQGTAQLIKGPVRGVYDTFTDLGFWDEVLHGWPARAMPDVNGDGRPELLGRWRWGPEGEDIQRETWVLMCSPFDWPLDLSTGIPLVPYHGFPLLLSSFVGRDSVDLDGDGLPELVDTLLGLEHTDEDPQPSGLSIWYGSDLAAACAAHTPAAP